MRRPNNPIEATAAALYSAVAKDLPDIEYERRRPGEQETTTRKRRPRADECEVYSFPQLWSNTALGFGGMAGQAMTYAQTTVVKCVANAKLVTAVYFDGLLAYVVDPDGEYSVFDDDIGLHDMEPAQDADAYGTVLALGPCVARKA